MPRTHDDTPDGWTTLMAPFLGVTPKLAAELWAAYALSCHSQVPTLLFELGRIADVIAGQDRHEPLQGRLVHYVALLAPKDMLAATLALSPETGRPRRKEIVTLEGVILGNIDKTGAWK
jgi:hypothetical protein